MVGARVLGIKTLEPLTPGTLEPCAEHELRGAYFSMKLKRELNLLDVFCIASGAMISSGLFILPGLAHGYAGPAVVVSYFLAGLLAMTGMLSQAELVSAMPKAGGTYFYVTRSMGPAVGTIDGLITWFSLSLKSTFALVGMAAFTAIAVNLDMRLVAVVLCLFFTAINIFGVKGAGRLQVGLVIILLAILVVYVIWGLPAVKVQYFEPFAPHGMGAVLATAGFVFVSYGGLLKVSSIAEEVKNPSRVIPLGMIFSLLVVGLLYILVIFVTSGVLGAGQLDYSLTPISAGAGAFMGPAGVVVLSIAAILAFISTANAGIMASSRYLLALSRDELLPGFLGRINRKFHTPHTAIIITSLVMIGALFVKLDALVKAASAVLILTYIFSCVSVIILRESRLQNYQPHFKAPLYPWLQIAGIIGFISLLLAIGKAVFVMVALFVLGGFLVYWCYGRIRSGKEYALLHLIERVTAKELTSRSLETELKEIIRERDDIIKDQFDKVIENSAVLDIEKKISLEEFFKLAAGTLSPQVGKAPEVLLRLLLEREKKGTTVLNPFLAIPHIIIEGEHIFSILMVRSREGIEFSPGAGCVHAVFFLVGTMDERNFHLRALAAIAQIVHDPGFGKRWLAARCQEALRDIILLGKRKRNL